MNAVPGMMAIAQRNADGPEYVRRCLTKSAIRDFPTAFAQ